MSARFPKAALLLAALALLAAANAQGAGFTDQFPLAACDFKPSGGNAFLNLAIGRQLYFSNVRCVGAGEVDEISRNYVASCEPMGDD